MTARPDVAAYLMNPAEDVLVPGTELAEGMLVIPESRSVRISRAYTEDDELRQQRFRRVTRLQHATHHGHDDGGCTVFVAEWVDGYQEVCHFAVTHWWIVKRDSAPGGAS